MRPAHLGFPGGASCVCSTNRVNWRKRASYLVHLMTLSQLLRICSNEWEDVCGR